MQLGEQFSELLRMYSRLKSLKKLTINDGAITYV
jgi:hypothetical protein